MGQPYYRANVLVCGGTGCSSSDSKQVYESMLAELQHRGLHDEVRVVQTGCRGFCAMGPVMMVYPEGIFYCRVEPKDVATIVEETLIKGRPVERLTYQEPTTLKALPRYHDIPFYSKQKRIVLRNCGVIDPERIDEYIAREGYAGLAKALGEMTPQQVRDEVKRSGLRGRGGGGFTTGAKWEFTAKAAGDKRYVVCNADEGDPGAFMDRSVLEGDPHSVLEGMAIAAYAIGAEEGYVYCRAEYPLAIERLKTAIAQAEAYGLLGDDILGTGTRFHLHIKEGAGAFVCGEETALIASIEGRRGEPRPRPPFPSVAGLWDKPTNVNNVKSYASVAQILLNGADWFRSIGTEGSPGTAVFALTGKVCNTGLVEVPMGITLGEIVFDIGGGVPGERRFKAVQTGGPLGGCLPAKHLNIQVDFDSLREAGAVMGSGGMIVVDEETCMVEFSRFFLTFAAAESCGKCVPCRVGGQRMLDVLNRISTGHGKLEDLDTLKELAQGMASGSLCGLGQLTPGPVMSALRYFEDEFRTHILEGRCPSGACKTLVRARCTNACPVEVDVPAYVALVAAGRYAEALEIHRERNPFALICGRVCRSFCEKRCRRADIGKPLDIQHVKRFMADHEMGVPWTPPIFGEPKGKKVAVIGSGPAGLTAALRLAQQGYQAVVFEKLPVAGGMMAVGIPEYRLPRDILNLEIDHIRRAGVEIRLNQELGRDMTIEGLLGLDGYSAVVLALGAHKEQRLRIPGEDLPGVLHGTRFLRDVSLGNPPDVKDKRVAIVGGGPVALDVARTALRLGASKVHVVYRRTKAEMPAWADEIRAADHEGVQFHCLTNPIGVVGDTCVTGLECQAQRLHSFDESSRRRPEPIPGSEFVLAADIVVPAIGQTIEAGGLGSQEGLSFNRNGTLTVGPSLSTTLPGVFAAGDATLGPATVAEAVAQGNVVAVAVDNYLQGKQVDRPKFVTPIHEVERCFDPEEFADVERAVMPELPLEERLTNFDEVELGFDERTAQEECKRCLRCDLEWLETVRPLIETPDEVTV